MSVWCGCLAVGGSRRTSLNCGAFKYLRCWLELAVFIHMYSYVALTVNKYIISGIFITMLRELSIEDRHLTYIQRKISTITIIYK